MGVDMWRWHPKCFSSVCTLMRFLSLSREPRTERAWMGLQSSLLSGHKLMFSMLVIDVNVNPAWRR